MRHPLSFPVGRPRLGILFEVGIHIYIYLPNFVICFLELFTINGGDFPVEIFTVKRGKIRIKKNKIEIFRVEVRLPRARDDHLRVGRLILFFNF